MNGQHRLGNEHEFHEQRDILYNVNDGAADEHLDSEQRYSAIGASHVGRAGELLVMSDLLRQGCGVASVDGDIHTFDLVAIVQENTLFKVQVKTVSTARGSGPYPGAYQWSLRKQQRPRVAYKPTDVDVFALVGLEHNIIAYKPMGDLVKQSGVITSINLTVDRMAPLQQFPFLNVDGTENGTLHETGN